MITSINAFHESVGKILMECQCIEHDIKLIYAGMLKGDIDENYALVAEQPLGPVLKKLELLDNSDGNPYLSKQDYELLDDIRDIRNHWAHKAYTMFIYKRGQEYDDAFIRQARRLDNDLNRITKLSGSIEKVRFSVLRKYDRID